jgi:uncharacterized protein (DUF2062 family)
MTEPRNATTEQQNQQAVGFVRPPRNRMHVIVRRAKVFLKLRVLHVNDTPHRIAMGVAVGVFVGISMAPFLGIHTIIVLLLAVLLRANKAASLASMWIHNPLTMWPIVFAEYELGKGVVRIFSDSYEQGEELLRSFLKNWEARGIFMFPFDAEFWREFTRMMVKIGLEVSIGCIVLGAGGAAISYFAAKEIITEHRKRSPHRRYRMGF